MEGAVNARTDLPLLPGQPDGCEAIVIHDLPWCASAEYQPSPNDRMSGDEKYKDKELVDYAGPGS
jgi:hypothetical protein